MAGTKVGQQISHKPWGDADFCVPHYGTTTMAEKRVDSYRFLHGVEKTMLRRWANLPRETKIPWTPLARPLPHCTVSLISSAGIALNTDAPFDPEIETHDPWFADPSYRLLPQTVRTGAVQVCHRHINRSFAEQDLNSVLPTERLQELAELGEIGAAARSHYSYMGYTLRPERLLRESVPGIVLRLREEHIDVVVLIPV
jgi:D-proline reductase (dithiol) PrdB